MSVVGTEESFFYLGFLFSKQVFICLPYIKCYTFACLQPQNVF